MASISSTSTSSTSSLGNTSLRGFGGMVSGIDRDTIIEQMTLKTTTKINNQKKAITELQWKQEAYRGLSDKILDLSDKYASYSSSSNLKDASVFAKSQITVHGKDDSTQFVTANGTSQLVNNVSILGVGQLATSTVRRSEAHVSAGGIQTTLKGLDDTFTFSNLNGARLTFGVWKEGTEGKVGEWQNTVNFTFPTSFQKTGADGKTTTVNIDYVKDKPNEIVDKLNDYLKESNLKLGDTAMKDAFEFQLSSDGKIQLNELTGSGKGMGGYTIQASSTALSALGYVKGSGEYDKDGISLDEFNVNVSKEFDEASKTHPTALSYLTSQKLTFNYDGSQKSIELITKDEAAELQKMIDDGYSMQDVNDKMAANLQTRLEQAFGKGMVTAEFGADGLVFNAKKPTSTLSITSSDSDLLTNLGLEYGSSTRVNLDGKITQDALLGEDLSGVTVTKPDSDILDLKINGVEITGLTKNSSISDILSKINSTSAAGVKATYVSSTGEFMLVSSETGEGREISLDSDLAKALFGQYEKDADGKYDLTNKKTDADGNELGVTEGQNAKIYVSYGDGEPVLLDRASNTFNLEGLNVTVSGQFGLKEGAVLDDTISRDSFNTADSVTFTAKADVDGVTEKVKSFFEDFNALVTEISTQVRTRPDNNYGALTDEQKAEMDETSIENWETKAKQGILYGDSIVRDMSADVEAIFSKLMQYGASYEDLKEIGITYSEDYLDGGTLVFDETAFRNAMETDPDKVANIFAGGGGVSKGLIDVVDETFTPYATKYASKNGNSYGRLIEIAGSEKKPTTMTDNEIYRQLKEMQEAIDKLQEQLAVEQDRYISQFTTMETLINQMNTQASYLSQITG